jgi:predicted PurR-regulated permease PerM
VELRVARRRFQQAITGSNANSEQGKVTYSDMTDVEHEKELGSLAGPGEMPLPSDPRTVFLAGLFVLAALTAAYLASEIVLPLVLAFILKLLLQPVVRALERLYVPRTLASLLLILLVFGTIAGLTAAISGPASTWAAKLPESVSRLESHLMFLRAPIRALQRLLEQVGAHREGGSFSPTPIVTEGSTLLVNLIAKVFAGTQSFASGFFVTVLFLFFLLVHGDTFLRRIVEILPHFGNKRRVVEISQTIESDISIYLLTITIMNVAVGTASAIAMWLTGLGDPILWGTFAFLLNYVPILGPASGIVIFLLAGLLTMDTLWQALLPAGLYFGIHLAEGEIITPLLLARRFTLNPVLVVLSLIFWFWMWGAAGAIIAVPMLAIAKIVCDRIQPLAALGHVLEG